MFTYRSKTINIYFHPNDYFRITSGLQMKYLLGHYTNKCKYDDLIMYLQAKFYWFSRDITMITSPMVSEDNWNSKNTKRRREFIRRSLSFYKEEVSITENGCPRVDVFGMFPMSLHSSILWVHDRKDNIIIKSAVGTGMRVKPLRKTWIQDAINTILIWSERKIHEKRFVNYAFCNLHLFRTF